MKIFNKIKENKKISKISKFLSNKRNSAFVKLGLWAIFFAVIAIFVRVSNDKALTPTKSYTVPEILQDIKNYSFDYEIIHDDNKTLISGNYNNEMIAHILENVYFISDDFYIVKGEILEKAKNPIDINFNKINISNIYTLIKDKEALYTENLDDKKITVYRIDGTLFSDMMEDGKEFTEPIEISIITLNNKCTSIYIDLTKYINSSSLIYKNYTVNLKLSSINEVSAFIYSDILNNNKLEGE
ncbi:MAG: hypothetical protein NC181_05310 [Clostridium sp.]|nr:hypothetical protein [Clostridium sp.]MCM1444729.1 hypothetical protein [Candidatus Amulumruptor caecigallinarius]